MFNVPAFWESAAPKELPRPFCFAVCPPDHQGLDPIAGAARAEGILGGGWSGGDLVPLQSGQRRVLPYFGLQKFHAQVRVFVVGLRFGLAPADSQEMPLGIRCWRMASFVQSAIKLVVLCYEGLLLRRQGCLVRMHDFSTFTSTIETKTKHRNASCRTGNEKCKSRLS